MKIKTENHFVTYNLEFTIINNHTVTFQGDVI